MKFKNIVALSILAMSLCACESETQDTPGNKENGTETGNRSNFQIVCEASSGKITGEENNERCKCGEEVCDSGVVCNLETGACSAALFGKCTSKEQACSNGKLYVCDGEKWTFKENCSAGLGCNSDQSTCAECLENACSEGKLRICNAGMFSSEIVDCSSNQCTDEHHCKSECNSGETRCFNGKMQSCNEENTFVDDENGTCPVGCNTEKTACATTCTEGATVCSDGEIRTCKNGVLGEPTTCGEGIACKSESECGDCKDGTTQCTEDDDGVGQLQTCKNGVWGTAVTCENNGKRVSCDNNNAGCGECLNGVAICENNNKDIGVLYQCANGQKIDEVKCTKSMTYYDDDDNKSLHDIYVSCNTSGTACGECLKDVNICVQIGKAANLYNCGNGVKTGDPIKECDGRCDLSFTMCR